MNKKIIIALMSVGGVFLSPSFALLNIDYLYSSRIIAMGGAGVAVVDDASAVFLNPAGLGNLTNSDISASYGSLLADVSQQSIVGSVGLGKVGQVGFGYSLMGVNNIPLTDSSGNLIGTADFYNSNMAISYGYLVYDWLLLGAKVHRLFSGGFGNIGEGYGLGMGLLLKPSRNINIGLSIEDVYATDFIWNNGSYEKIVKKNILGLSFQPIHNKVLFAMDLSGNAAGAIDRISVGGEFTIVEWLKLRMGGLFSKDTNAKYVGTGSAGLGINIFNNLNIDYAVQRLGGMRTDSQYISMRYKF